MLKMWATTFKKHLFGHDSVFIETHHSNTVSFYVKMLLNFPLTDAMVTNIGSIADWKRLIGNIY